MILTIADILDPSALSSLMDDLKTVRWLDGSKTAGRTAEAVKRNQQADLSSRTGLTLRDRLDTALQSHPVLRAAAQPARFSRPLISRTDVGGGYGRHIDNPFMDHGENAVRTDLSYTLFLSDPDAYEGGELMIERPSGIQSVKLPSGSLILYPSRFLHAVNSVTKGTRIVCIGWIESRVRQDSRREILFDLENLAATLSTRYDAQSSERLTLAKIIANLKRDFD